MKRRRIHRQPRSRFPAQINRQPVAGLPIRKSRIGLQQQHRGHHPRRHRRAAQHRALKQVGEILLAEQRTTMLSQQPIDTAYRQLITHQQHRVIESALPVFTSQRHTPILQAHPRQTRSGTPKPGSQNQRRPSTIEGPLAGLRVIELAGIGPGPFAATLLADLGARSYGSIGPAMTPARSHPTWTPFAAVANR